MMKTEVIIPAYNEEHSIAQVIEAIPAGCVERIIVVDNASTDATASLAREAGAHVVYEGQRGYGSACLRGIEEASDADVILFLDADFSDDPSKAPELLSPIINNKADLVIGSRILGDADPGALPPHARFGNILACFLIRRLYGYAFTDLGPFRAIRRDALERIEMKDTNYGWTVEMQVKAAIAGLRCVEIPVPYKIRIGRSKISGTISGSVKAGVKILWTVFSLWFQRRPERN
ncbi:MAG: glycosyltransferase family 2 protein [Candidatus Hinthialibacter antarcticus]|nr:glycosyltransferase family 2 protein [Candidatus Hinthialibacter antarcticus]